MTRKTMKDLAAQWSTRGNQETTRVDYSRYFDFWKMNDGGTAIVRFLPDLNEDNPLGFIYPDFHHVIDGKKTVCIGDGCPHCAEANKYFKLSANAKKEGEVADAERLREEAMRFYRKVQYIGQVVVIDAGGVEYSKDHKLHLVSFGPKLFKVIEAAMKSGDLENDPSDPELGYNFRIRKTKNGEWSDYTTSSFAPKATSLANGFELLEFITDLSDYRTK